MRLGELAKRLSDTSRVGLDAELITKLGLKSEDATRGYLLSQEEERGHLGVYLLGAYVIDDTDLWGDGEIYWFSIPVLTDKQGQSEWDPVLTLPSGAAPHRVGSLEWMTNISLAEPPVLALIPPRDDLASLTLRLAFYDDDKKPADMPAAMKAGLEVLAGMRREGLRGPDEVIKPVREAILRGLIAQEDDILIDQDVVIRRGESSGFGAGLVGSCINHMVRVFYFVRDEQRTQQIGPIQLHRGQLETVKFPGPVVPGGRIALFSRGAEVRTTAFGNLDTDAPFVNRIVDSSNAASLGGGFNLNGTGPAKFVAFYTPP
jgi:hypothetical protein